MGKWAQLAVAATAIESEIYTYRARVKDYSPRLKALSMSSESTMGKPKSRVKAGSSSKETSGSSRSPRPATSFTTTRRQTFSSRLEDIQSRVCNGELKRGSLTPAQTDAFVQVQKMLQEKVRDCPTKTDRQPLLQSEKAADG